MSTWRAEAASGGKETHETDAQQCTNSQVAPSAHVQSMAPEWRLFRRTTKFHQAVSGRSRFVAGAPADTSTSWRQLAAVITCNTALGAMPGNVFLPAAATGLSRDSVVNMTALVTVAKADRGEPVGRLPDHLMDAVERALRRVLRL